MKKRLKKLVGVYIFTRIKFIVRAFICFNPKDNYFLFLNKKFQTPKCSLNYDDYYISFFRGIRKKKLKILEIGIGGHEEENYLGGSLLVWNSYFPRSQIYGIDLSKKTLFNRYRRIQTFVVDQSRSDSLDEFAKEYGPFDIIIDDGSHFTDHILTTFNSLYKFLRSEGCYVIEDMGTTYMKSFSGEPDIDRNSDFFMRTMTIAKMTTRGFISDIYNDKKEEFSKLHSIVFGNGIVIIKNSEEKDYKYGGSVDPWLDRDELRKNDDWIQSTDGYGKYTEKLDSGQMGR